MQLSGCVHGGVNRYFLGAWNDDVSHSEVLRALELTRECLATAVVTA